MAEPLLDSPKHWQKVTLEPNGRAGYIEAVASGSTPKTTCEDYWDGNIPWLTPKEITSNRSGIYVSQTERSLTDEGLASSSATLLEIGTVMLTKRAPVRAVAVNAVPMTTNQGFLNFRCGYKLLPLYLAYWLKINKPYLDTVANGSTYPELYKGDF